MPFSKKSVGSTFLLFLIAFVAFAIFCAWLTRSRKTDLDAVVVASPLPLGVGTPGIEAVTALAGVTSKFENLHDGTVEYVYVERIPSLLRSNNKMAYVWRIRIKGRFHVHTQDDLTSLVRIQIMYAPSHVSYTTFEGKPSGTLMIGQQFLNISPHLRFTNDQKRRMIILSINRSFINKLVQDPISAPHFVLDIEMNDSANCSGCNDPNYIYPNGQNYDGYSCYSYNGNAYVSDCAWPNGGNCCCQGSGGNQCFNCGVGIFPGEEIGCSCTACGDLPDLS